MLTHKSIGYSGRLGNQMFQYAALKALSLETGFKCFLPNHLAIKPDGAFDLTNNKWLEYKLDLLECFQITTPIQENTLTKTYQEKGFTFDPGISLVDGNTAIEGYFQSYKYFEAFAKDIKKEFTFRPNILEKCKNIILKYTNPVSIHIRRGDYVNHPAYWTVTPEYIINALQAFNPGAKATYLVFSDDIEWCKEIFGEDFIFVEGNNQYEDLCLMSLCKHNIIANSSYSWWGAWLNSNKNKKVVAPSQWFTDGKSLEDLYPKDWIII
jgi:hypothetical protein